MAYVELNKLDKARDHFLLSVDYDSDFAPAWYHLGHVMESLHMVNETKAYFEKATQVDQNYTDAYYNLGEFSMPQGNLILLAGITRLQLKFLQIMLMYTTGSVSYWPAVKR